MFTWLKNIFSLNNESSKFKASEPIDLYEDKENSTEVSWRKEK